MTASQVDLIIRPPRPSELPACRMLLPEACLESASRSFLLAFDPSGARIEGALSFRDAGRAVGSVRVHVIPPRRRTGVGSRLLDYATDEARRLGRERVIADLDLHRDPGAEPFLLANGFSRTSRLTSVEGVTAAVLDEWKATGERVPPLSDVSPDARIVGIEQAPIKKLVEMYAAYIVDIPMIAGLEQAWRLEQFTESVILMIRDRVIGCMLAEIKGAVLRIPAWIVEPEYRGKLVGLQLRTALHQRLKLRLHEFEHIQFDFLDKATATAKIAGRSDYRVVALNCRFERNLPV